MRAGVTATLYKSPRNIDSEAPEYALQFLVSALQAAGFRTEGRTTLNHACLRLDEYEITLQVEAIEPTGDPVG